MDLQGLLWTRYAFKEFCKLFPHYALAKFLKSWFNAEIQAILDSSVEVYELKYVALMISRLKRLDQSEFTLVRNL